MYIVKNYTNKSGINWTLHQDIIEGIQWLKSSEVISTINSRYSTKFLQGHGVT